MHKIGITISLSLTQMDIYRRDMVQHVAKTRQSPTRSFDQCLPSSGLSKVKQHSCLQKLQGHKGKSARSNISWQEWPIEASLVAQLPKLLSHWASLSYLRYVVPKLGEITTVHAFQSTRIHQIQIMLVVGHQGDPLQGTSGGFRLPSLVLHLRSRLPQIIAQPR